MQDTSLLPPDKPYDPLTADDMLTRVTSDVAQMHWQQLKVLVESYGGSWSGKEDAVQFLHGRAG